LKHLILCDNWVELLAIITFYIMQSLPWWYHHGLS